MGENKVPDNPKKRDLFAELSEMSVREVESQIPGTADRETEETEGTEQKAWKNRIRTISQRKAARIKETAGKSGSLPDEPSTEKKETEKKFSVTDAEPETTEILADSVQADSPSEVRTKKEPDNNGILSDPVQADSPSEVRTKKEPDNNRILSDSVQADSPSEVRPKKEPDNNGIFSAFGRRVSSDAFKQKKDPQGSGLGKLEEELHGASRNYPEEETGTVSSLDLERELLNVRAEPSSGSGKNERPDLSEIGLEFEKNSVQNASGRSAGTDSKRLADEDTFYADIAIADNEKSGPVNEPLKGERYDPMEEERERQEKKDRLIRIILFMALMLVAGALLTYVTFIRDSGKSDSGTSKNIASGSTEKDGSRTSESAGTESDGTSTESAVTEDVGDISTEDLSAYLSEMPAEGTEIVSTADAVYSYEQMVKDLYFLTNRYPDIIRTNIAATTLDQRAVYEVLIGNPEGSMHVVVTYGMRGDEYITTLLAMRQLEYYCQERSKGNVYRNHNYKEIFADVCIHVLPMVNPDGVTLSQFGIESLRTKAAKDSVKACYKYDKAAGLTDQSLEAYLLTFGANASGVDISKNFPAGWDEYTGGAVQPSFEGYKGPSAGSEPETQAVMNAANDMTKGIVIYRATGNVIYWDYGSEGTVHEEGQHLAESLATRSGYPLTVLPKYDSTDAGGCADYFIEKGIPAVSLVVGEGTSPVDISAFPDIWTANLNILPMLANLYTNG